MVKIVILIGLLIFSGCARTHYFHLNDNSETNLKRAVALCKYETLQTAVARGAGPHWQIKIYISCMASRGFDLSREEKSIGIRAFISFLGTVATMGAITSTEELDSSVAVSEK